MYQPESDIQQVEKPESKTEMKPVDQPASDRDTKQVEESELIEDKVEKVDLPDKHNKINKQVCFSEVETKVIKEPSSSECLDDTLEIIDLVIDSSASSTLCIHDEHPPGGDVALDDEDLEDHPPGGDVPLEDRDLFESTPPCSQMPCIDPYKRNHEKASNR